MISGNGYIIIYNLKKTLRMSTIEEPSLRLCPVKKPATLY